MKKPVILFDGLCNLCNASVQFVIRHDSKAKFLLGSLQSTEGKDLAQQHQLNSEELRTFILVTEEKAYTKSTAALKVVSKLNGLWPILAIFLIVPKFIRDFIYDFISKHRYKWFGKREACWVPNQNLRNRFIEKF